MAPAVGLEPTTLKLHFNPQVLFPVEWTLSSSHEDVPCKVSTLARSCDLLARRWRFSVHRLSGIFQRELLLKAAIYQKTVSHSTKLSYAGMYSIQITSKLSLTQVIYHTLYQKQLFFHAIIHFFSFPVFLDPLFAVSFITLPA